MYASSRCILRWVFPGTLLLALVASVASPAAGTAESVVLSAGAVGTAAAAAAQTEGTIPRFDLLANPIALRGPAQPGRYMEASGRQAAISVDRYLKGEHLKFNRAYAGPFVTDFEIDTRRGSQANRVIPTIDICKAPGDFTEIEQPYREEQARTEAQRCYSCGNPYGRYRTCWFCLPCEVECPEEALWVEVPYLLR